MSEVDVLRISGKTLLVVDDEIDLRDPLRAEFESYGARVLEASSGRAALAVLKEEHIDAIISDVRMPNGDGVDLLKAVRKLHFNIPPVALITGYSGLSYDEAYELGAEVIVAKPFDLDDIDATAVHILTPLEERWRQPVPQNVTLKLAASFDDFDEMASSGRLSVGRGGFFYGSSADLPGRNDVVSFAFSFEAGGLKSLCGTGVVRWVRYQAQDAKAAGFGVEFLTLDEASGTEVLALAERLQTLSFIPSK